MAEHTPTRATDPGHRNLLILLFAGFILTGVTTVIIGPLLPLFIQRWSLDDGQAGFFFTVQFVSSTAGVGLSSVLASRWGYRPPLVVGYAFMGAGLAALNSGSHAIALAATAAFGAGYGLVIPGSNLLAAEAGGKKSASLLNLLNFAWGLGAVTCSPMILMGLKRQQLPALLIGFAVMALFMVLGLLFVSFGAKKQHEASNAAESGSGNIGFAVAIALAAMFFIYVAMENSIGGWAAEHAKRLAKGPSGLTTLAPMFFYAGLMLGRATAPLFLLRLDERQLVLGALCLTALGTTIEIESSSLKTAIVGVSLAGAGCASTYPIYIAWLSSWLGARARRIGGIYFALGSLGGSFGPWFVGFVSKLSGSLRVGLLVPLVSAVIMICLVVLLRKQTAA